MRPVAPAVRGGLRLVMTALWLLAIGAAAGVVAFGRVHVLLAAGAGVCLLTSAGLLTALARQASWTGLALSLWSVGMLGNLFIFQFTVGGLPPAAFLASVGLFVIFLHLLRRFVARALAVNRRGRPDR